MERRGGGVGGGGGVGADADGMCSQEHHSDFEPRTPKQQTRKPGLADQGNSPDSTLSGPYSGEPHPVCTRPASSSRNVTHPGAASPFCMADSPMKRFLATTGALSSKGAGAGLTSRSIRFGNSGLNRYGYSLTAARQSVRATPARSAGMAVCLKTLTLLFNPVGRSALRNPNTQKP